MPTKTLYLEQESSEQIVISNGYNWKNLTITKDGEFIGKVGNVKALQEGREFQLSDGRMVSIKLIKKFGFIRELEILLDGIPIPGSGTEPNQQIKQVYHLLLFIAAFNVLIGLIAVFANVEFLKSLGSGYGTIVEGIIYGVLAYLIRFKHSLAALYIAISLLILDIIFTFIFAAQMGGNPMSGLFVKGFFAFMLFNGIAALKKVRNHVTSYNTSI